MYGPAGETIVATRSRWNDDELNALKRQSGNEFEVVKMGPMTTQWVPQFRDHVRGDPYRSSLRKAA